MFAVSYPFVYRRESHVDRMLLPLIRRLKDATQMLMEAKRLGAPERTRPSHLLDDLVVLFWNHHGETMGCLPNTDIL